MKQEEINKRFDEKFPKMPISAQVLAYPTELKSFLHSEISLAVAEREKEIVEMINEYDRFHCGPEEIINLIKQK